jgi:hypothetical protein
VIARVGSAELTDFDLRAAGADSLSAVRGYASEYVSEWVISELLYQEATRRGLSDSDELRRQLEETRKSLAIAALLDKELSVSHNDTAWSLDSAQAFYRAHPDEFTLKEDVALISLAVFPEREQANIFRSSLLRGQNWESSVAAIGSDSLGAPQILRMHHRQYFLASTLLPQELWRLARTIARDEPSYAVRTDQGYAILQVHSFKQAGEVADFDYVRPEIAARFLIEHRRRQYDRLVATLRSRRAADIRVSRPDTLLENE